MLAVYELVRFLLANKRQTVCCDWLAVVNIMVAEWTDASCVDYTNYSSPFYLCIIHDCTQADFGHLRFRLQAIKQITAAATSSSSAEPAVSTILLSNKMLSCVTQMLTNICWSCVCGFTGSQSSAATGVNCKFGLDQRLHLAPTSFLV